MTILYFTMIWLWSTFACVMNRRSDPNTKQQLLCFILNFVLGPIAIIKAIHKEYMQWIKDDGSF